MSVRSCPHCRHEAPRLLDGPSAGALVSYFRCDVCGHVFALRKDNPSVPPWTVVPGKGDPSAL
jgi:transposase-like protein